VAKSSYWGRLIDLAPESYDDEAPVSVSVTQTVLNNLAHLTDEACQVRVNWTAQAYGTGVTHWVLSRQEDTVSIYQVEFPLTWLSPTKPANLEIVFHAYGLDESDDDPYVLSTYLVGANSAPGSKTSVIMSDVVEADSDAVTCQSPPGG
jgi:hypothetical protein